MHLKRLNTPKRWNVAKKVTKFITKPSPGPHSNDFSLPLVVVLRDHLKLVDTKKEVKRLINNKEILVDLKVVKDASLPLGLFDVIAIPKYNLYYRMILDIRGGLSLVKINSKESNVKLLNIVNKTRIKKGLLQLNFLGGRNMVVKKNEYNILDSILFDLKTNKIIKHIKAGKGMLSLVIHGKHVGETAIIQSYKNFKSMNKDQVILKPSIGKEYETMKNFAFVVGSKTPEITIKEGKK